MPNPLYGIQLDLLMPLGGFRNQDPGSTPLTDTIFQLTLEFFSFSLQVLSTLFVSQTLPPSLVIVLPFLSAALQLRPV